MRAAHNHKLRVGCILFVNFREQLGRPKTKRAKFFKARSGSQNAYKESGSVSNGTHAQSQLFDMREEAVQLDTLLMLHPFSFIRMLSVAHEI